MTNQTVKIPKAVLFFQKELNDIKNTELNAFFTNVLASAPVEFQKDKELLSLVKKAHHIMSAFLEEQNVMGEVKDAMTGTVLIAKILHHQFRAPFQHLGALGVNAFLKEKKLNKDIPVGLWQNIMRAVEAHEGPQSASVLLEPRPGTAEYEVYMAFRVAKLSFLNLIDTTESSEGESNE